MAGLVLVLGAAVLVNWYYTDPEKNHVSVENGSDVNEANGKNLGDKVGFTAVNSAHTVNYFPSEVID